MLGDGGFRRDFRANLNTKTFDRFSTAECTKYGRFLRCFLCWEFCFYMSNTKAEILSYCIILAWMGASSLVLLLPISNNLTQHTPCCRNSTADLAEVCQEYSGQVFVYRQCLAFVSFFLICALLHWAAKRSREFKTNLRRGLWFGKVLVLLVIALGVSYIPAGSFDEGFTIFLMFGAVIFMVIQLYTFVRFSYVIIYVLQKKADRGSRQARRLQILLFVVGVVLAVTGNCSLMYLYPLCTENSVFLITNISLPFLACLWSTSDCVRAKNGYSGYIQGSILTCFITGHTWSAFSNNPDPSCNPYFIPVTNTNPYQILYFAYSFGVYLMNAVFTYNIHVEELRDEASSTTREECTAIAFPYRGTSEDESTADDLTRVKYSWVFCNLICATLMCFVVMSYVNWAPGNAGADHVKSNRNAMWFKFIGCWFSIFFFLATLYTPSVYGLKLKPTFVRNS